MLSKYKIKELERRVEGEVYGDKLHKLIYSTDASAYKENPKAVLIPKSKNDIREAIKFGIENSLTIIPRTAGTSLAGQVVGNGLIVDCSKYMNNVIELNVQEKWVRVQPGVILDELNISLKKHGLFFGPETSTSNRCMIGGMVGNNSCGAHSLVYGSTREHTLEINAILSDGSEVLFKKLSKSEFNDKIKLETLEGDIYRQVYNSLSNAEIRNRIKSNFPDPAIERRNTGYAIDLLCDMEPFVEGGEFNFCKLLCGSEGTLAFVTEIKLNLVSVPPPEKALLVVHHKTIDEALKANIVALRHGPVAVELIDKYLLDCTKTSAEHKKNRFFLEGDPGALLCIELAGSEKQMLELRASEIVEDFKSNGYGTSFPILFDKDISRVWALRKAGLGLLSNIPGDAKPQPVIEDTAVSPEKLPDYISEFNKVLEVYNLECVYYAHIATGELHLRPVLNLKDKNGVKLFRTLATEIAQLVKKYGGSLSGEHGDGRLRGEFISYMIGEENYNLLKEIKRTWDPQGVFNIGKITDTPPMDTSLRFMPGQKTPRFKTAYDFSHTLGVVRMAEKCNGSADCRKSAIIGGTMCPSFQATKDEKHTTRARANALREVLNSNKKENKFDSEEIFDILELCLSCKGCKTECPSGVDMAKLKSEFLYQYYKSHWIPIRSRLIAGYSMIQKYAVNLSRVYNFLITNKLFSYIVKTIVGFNIKRSLPIVNRVTWSKWLTKNIKDLNNSNKEHLCTVAFFIDEFTNYNEAEIGISASRLLSALGYKIELVKHIDSGRALFSKGFLNKARHIAERNINVFEDIANRNISIVGIEPSAVLSFRDEYPDILRGSMKEKAVDVSKNVYTIEEFIYKEIKEGKISNRSFSEMPKKILYHGHCQQKALVGTNPALEVLSIPVNYEVEEIKSGCCGMAGSFGYEKEHYDLSMKIGELVLFPKIRQDSELSDGAIVVASGTSCRHHIKDGTGIKAYHPVQILLGALLK